MKKFPKPLVLKGYRFRRRDDRPDLALIELMTTEGDVPICMTKEMLERLLRDGGTIAKRLTESTAKAS